MPGKDSEDDQKSQEPMKYVAARMSRGEAPKGAVMMSKDDIIQLQHKRINRWTPESDTRFFRYSHHILAASSAISAILVNTHFRNKFHLFSYGMAFSYAPTVVIPTIGSIIADELLMSEVMLQPECRECLEVRSGVVQAAISVFYSSIMAPLSSIYLSRKYYTYLTKHNFQPDLKHALKTTSFARMCGLWLVIWNFAVGAFVRRKQNQELEYIVAHEPYHVTKQLLETVRD